MKESSLKVRDLVTEDVKRLVKMCDSATGIEHHASFAVYDRRNKVMYCGRRRQDFSDEVLHMEVVSWNVEPDIQDFGTVIVNIEAEMGLAKT